MSGDQLKKKIPLTSKAFLAIREHVSTVFKTETGAEVGSTDEMLWITW